MDTAWRRGSSDPPAHSFLQDLMLNLMLKLRFEPVYVRKQHTCPLDPLFLLRLVPAVFQTTLVCRWNFVCWKMKCWWFPTLITFHLRTVTCRVMAKTSVQPLGSFSWFWFKFQWCLCGCLYGEFVWNSQSAFLLLIHPELTIIPNLQILRPLAVQPDSWP